MRKITHIICAGIVSVFLTACSPQQDLPALYKKTALRYDSLLKANPKDARIRLEAGRFYYEFHDFEKAKAALSGLADAHARALLAKTYAQLKDYTHALELFDQAGELDDPEYLYLYAQTLQAQNLFGKATALYKKVKPPFLDQARQRLDKMGIKIDESVPTEVLALLKEEDKFLAGINKEDSVTLLVDETYQVNDNNTSVATVHVIQKVLKEKGKDLAEVEIGYDSTYERIELEYARTITPDNKVVYAGSEHIRDVSKYLNFPLYSNAKAYIISMPSVEIGSIIEYKAKIYSSKLDTDKDFSTIYPLKDRNPIARANFTLVVPKSKKISFDYVNTEYAGDYDLKPVKTASDTQVTYAWRFKEIPPIIPEDGMPPPSRVNPAIKITSFSSWQDIYDWWYGLYKDKIILNADVKAFVKNLTKDCKNDLEKAKKIYEFCAKDVRYVGVEYGTSGYEPHKATDVFWNRYGDCKDKATLLVAMLKEAGIAAYPVLIPTRGTYAISKDFATINFNHAIAACELDGKLIFMDGTASTVSFGDIPLDDQERDVLVFFDTGYKVLATPLIKDNEVRYDMTVTIDSNEDAVISRTVHTKGSFASAHRYYLRYSHPQKIKEDIQKKMLEISPFSKLNDYNIENADLLDVPPVLSYTFSAKKFLNPTQNLRVFPSLSDIDIDGAYVNKDERNFPIEFDGIFRKTCAMKIILPENIRVKFLPANQEFDTPWFIFRVKVSSVANTLDFYQEFAITKRDVPRSEYRAFKNAVEEVAYLLREAIILEKKDEKENKEKRP